MSNREDWLEESLGRTLIDRVNVAIEMGYSKLSEADVIAMIDFFFTQSIQFWKTDTEESKQLGHAIGILIFCITEVDERYKKYTHMLEEKKQSIDKGEVL